MKLKDRNKGPIGGWVYRYEITRFNGLKFPAVVYGSTWNNLIDNIKKDMRSNAYQVPNDLEYQVEQQICSLQPPDRCWMQSGDVTASVIHSAARLIDRVAGTTLEKKAKGCKVCGQRREKMNKIL